MARLDIFHLGFQESKSKQEDGGKKVLEKCFTFSGTARERLILRTNLLELQLLNLTILFKYCL